MVKQRCTQFVFQLPDDFRQKRLGYARRRGCAGNVLHLRGQREIAQITKLYRSVLHPLLQPISAVSIFHHGNTHLPTRQTDISCSRCGRQSRISACCASAMPAIGRHDFYEKKLDAGPAARTA